MDISSGFFWCHHSTWTIIVVILGLVSAIYISHCLLLVVRTDHGQNRKYRQLVLILSMLLVGAVVTSSCLAYAYSHFQSKPIKRLLLMGETLVYLLSYAHAASVLYWLVLHFFLYQSTSSADESTPMVKSLSERYLLGWLCLYIVLCMLRDLAVQYILATTLDTEHQLGPLYLGLLFLIFELIPVSPTSMVVWHVNYAMLDLKFFSLTQRIAVPVARRMRRIIPYTTLIFCMELVFISMIYWDVGAFRDATPIVGYVGIRGPQFPFPTFVAVNPFVISTQPLTWLTTLSICLFVYAPVLLLAFGFTARESALFMMSVGNRGSDRKEASSGVSDVSEIASDYSGSGPGFTPDDSFLPRIDSRGISVN